MSLRIGKDFSSTPRRNHRRRADARRNEERLRQAAIDLLDESGKSITLDEIARRAGVSVGTLYNRFGGRSGLLEAVVDDVAQQRLQSAVASAQQQDSSWKRFATFLEGVCEFQNPNPAFDQTTSRLYCDKARALAVSYDAIAVGEQLIQDAREDG